MSAAEQLAFTAPILTTTKDFLRRINPGSVRTDAADSFREQLSFNPRACGGPLTG